MTKDTLAFPQNEINMLSGTPPIAITDDSGSPRDRLIAVIPAFNEEMTLGSVVILVRQYVERVIVIDDGSSDQTSMVANLAGADVIHLEKNMGKAFAILLGLRKAREMNCNAAVMLDADGQHQPGDIPRLANLVLNGEADLVIGSRVIEGNKNIPLYRRAGQRTLNTFTRVGTQHDVSDSQSGYRVLGRNALNNLDFHSDGYNIESDMIDQFIRKGLVIKEVAIDVRYDVPNKHKKNPMMHGVGVLTRLINIIGIRRPLLAFGIPGTILVLTGLAAEIWVFSVYYAGDGFHYVIGIASAFIVMGGLLLAVSGLILHTLVKIVVECKR